MMSYLRDWWNSIWRWHQKRHQSCASVAFIHRSNRILSSWGSAYTGTPIFKGEARVRRITAAKKHKAALASYYQWIKANRHKRLNKLIPALNRKVQGFRNYFALSGNSRSVSRVYDHILNSLYKWLNRRSQRKSFTWQGMKRMLKHFGFQSMRVRKPRTTVDWYYEKRRALHGQRY